MERMRTERSYDTIPSFTAADCVRLVNCGRNEFIHALNALRSKGWLWKRRRNLMLKHFPAAPPASLPVLHWWEVHPTRAAAGALKAAGKGQGAGGGRPSNLPRQATSTAAAMRRSVFGTVSSSSVPSQGEGGTSGGTGADADDDDEGGDKDRNGGPGPLSASEVEALGHVISGSAVLAGQLPKEVVGALHAAGLIRFQVPIDVTDRIAVPPLTNFVMNRVGHDYLEKAMYELFVSNDESSTLGSLASVLGQPKFMVTRAASVACRLGFAKKLTAPSLLSPPPPTCPAVLVSSTQGVAQGAAPPPPVPPSWHPSWHDAESDGARREVAGADGAAGGGTDGSAPAPEAGLPPGLQRIALLVDSKLSACLMMSNLADDLKQHAVTLYEAGKLPHETLDNFMEALTRVERPHIDEADVLEYFDQALALRHALTFLRSNVACEVDGSLRPIDIVRTESLATLEIGTRDRVLQRSYALLISMAPMMPLAEHIYTPTLPIPHFGPRHVLLASPWLRLAMWVALKRGPRAILLPRGTILKSVPAVLDAAAIVLVVPWGSEALPVAKESLLSVVADLLLRTPLLLQEHGTTTAESAATEAIPIGGEPLGGLSTEPEPEPEATEAVPMDVSDGGAGPASPPPEVAVVKSRSPRAEALAVQSALHLDHTIGSVQLVRLQDRWVPIALHLGLPLGDVPTCEAACAGIEARRLFSGESLAAHGNALDGLCARAESCVQVSVAAAEAQEIWEIDHDETTPDADAKEARYPPAALLFNGSELRPWNAQG